jgi:hypothetical protein
MISTQQSSRLSDNDRVIAGISRRISILRGYQVGLAGIIVCMKTAKIIADPFFIILKLLFFRMSVSNIFEYVGQHSSAGSYRVPA